MLEVCSTPGEQRRKALGPFPSHNHLSVLSRNLMHHNTWASFCRLFGLGTPSAQYLLVKWSRHQETEHSWGLCSSCCSSRSSNNNNNNNNYYYYIDIYIYIYVHKKIHKNSHLYRNRHAWFLETCNYRKRANHLAHHLKNSLWELRRGLDEAFYIASLSESTICW